MILIVHTNDIIKYVYSASNKYIEKNSRCWVTINLESEGNGEKDTAHTHERVSTNNQSSSSQRFNQKTLKHTNISLNHCELTQAE